ncbi:MAG: polyprenyl synthetase family protein [Legionellales bacterium]|nr:polyprenyl synthetase family protein [Legionellales bacterium]
MSDFQQFRHNLIQRVDQILDRFLPSIHSSPSRLHNAMRYAVLNNGKRIRPILVYCTGIVTHTNDDILDTIAATIELIHSYSLVHDDLPAIDNDDLRRGQPTCHKAFDEATAILVGDALQNLAFQVLTNLEHPSITPETHLRLLKILTRACDTTGMVGGQAIDIAATGKILSLSELEDMHRRKTGALLSACVEMVLATSTLNPRQQHTLLQFGQYIGLAFQIQDDILDVIGNTELLGKHIGQDQAQHKATYPALLGLEQAKNKAQQAIDLALNALNLFDEQADRLRELSRFIIERDN